MKERIVVVVGDKFKDFAAGKDVITLTQLQGMLSLSGMLAPQKNHILLMPGQGLRDSDIEQIRHQAINHQLFDLSLWQHTARRAPMKYSHKHKPENTLISEPVRLNEDLYELDLMIDENCELMNDHQTGQHVQGMVLFEAARQTFLAVTETFFLPNNDIGYYFVINQMGATYNRFAFPLGATIQYAITEKNIAKANRMSFKADITIEQCGFETASFSTDFTVFENKRISSMEGKLANQSLSSFLDQVASRRHRDIHFLNAA